MIDLDAMRARDAAWVPLCATETAPWYDRCELTEAQHIPDGPDAPEWVACETRRPRHAFAYPADSPEAHRRTLLALLTPEAMATALHQLELFSTIDPAECMRGPYYDLGQAKVVLDALTRPTEARKP